MKIAVVLNTYCSPDVILDDVAAIKTWVTQDVILVIDGAAWGEIGKIDYKVKTIKGFVHDYPKGPYRNATLGLMEAYSTYPNMDWYCYCDWDTLFVSNEFLEDLRIAKKQGVWVIGNDINTEQYKFPLLEIMLKTEFDCAKYLLACCMFFSGDFIKHLHNMDFFNKFLNLTSDFKNGEFPDYDGFDFLEHLYPTLANHYRGKVSQFAFYCPKTQEWRGDYKKYPMRWKPELDFETENFKEACIMHPLKSYNHPIRDYHRNKRKEFNVNRL